MDLTISTAATIIFGIIFTVIGYLLMQRDNQREKDITMVQTGIEDAAKLILAEKDRTAALLLSESRQNAALVLSEKEKLEARFKIEYKELDEKFTEHRIMVARDYATTSLVEKILAQVSAPIAKQLDEIEVLLSNKVDRREFEMKQKQQ